MTSHTISTMTPAHLEQAATLSQAESWPHRVEDWQMLHALSGGSVAVIATGVVGTALRTDYGADVSMLSMIIVGRTERGQGLGRKLMGSVMEDAGERELRLLATQAGLPLYEKLGFEAEGEITQCQGNVADVTPPKSEVSLATDDEMGQIIRLDSEHTAADRTALLYWLMQNGQLAVTRAETGEIAGYAALRRFGRGHVIGPIQASNAQQAKDLIRFFAAPLSGAFIRIDTDNALGLAPWLHDIGLHSAGGGVKMRKNPKTAQRPAFGMCSQALG